MTLLPTQRVYETVAEVSTLISGLLVSVQLLVVFISAVGVVLLVLLKVEFSILLFVDTGT